MREDLRRVLQEAEAAHLRDDTYNDPTRAVDAVVTSAAPEWAYPTTTPWISTWRRRRGCGARDS